LGNECEKKTTEFNAKKADLFNGNSII